MRPQLIRVVTATGVLALWELTGRVGLLPSTVLPPVSTIVASLVGLLRTAQTWFDLWVTAWEIGQGLVLGVLAGLVFAAIVGLSNAAWRLVEPLMYYLSSLPKIILLPLLLLFLGSGVFSKVGMGAISAFFPVAITTSQALHQVDESYVRAARCLGAGRRQLLLKVYLPSAIGPIMSGLRIGLGVAITGVLLAETSVASAGIGFRAINYYESLRIADMYALLLFVFVVAVVVNGLLGRLIRYLTRYDRATKEVFFS